MRRMVPKPPNTARWIVNVGRKTTTYGEGSGPLTYRGRWNKPGEKRLFRSNSLVRDRRGEAKGIRRKQRCCRLGMRCQPGGMVSCGWCWYLWPYSFQPAPFPVVPARILQPYSLKEAIWGRGYKEFTTGLEAASDQLSGEISLRQKLRIDYALQPTIQGRECVGLCSDIERDTVDGNLAESMCEDRSRSDNARGRSQRPPSCRR